MKPLPTTLQTDSSKFAASCWCGQRDLAPWSDDYALCEVCQSLVCIRQPHQPDPSVKDDRNDFYGESYWHEHQSDELGFPSIAERARNDLPERCIYWLNQLLKLRLPPGKLLELGSAHGGFIMLAHLAGFDASGLELSPAVCEFARKTFGVTMFQGPLEAQDSIADGSLDVIAAMDVIEHFPDPIGTLATCAQKLKPDGLLLIQTPRYPEGATFSALSKAEDRFPHHLKPGEHVMLFSRTSARMLMNRVGLTNVEHFPAIFEFYDQFFVASRAPISRVGDNAFAEHFTRTPKSRAMLAMLDAEERFRGLLAKHRALLKSGSASD